MAHRAVPYASINGQRIRYMDSGGDLPSVVLSHGFLTDADVFGAQAEALVGAGYRVVTWDARGFGQTEWDGQPVTYWDLAHDCLALMDQLDITRAVLGGRSQGGFISLRAALTAPERVRALVLISTSSDRDSPDSSAAYGAMLRAWLEHGPAPVQDLVAAALLTHPGQVNHAILTFLAKLPE